MREGSDQILAYISAFKFHFYIHFHFKTFELLQTLSLTLLREISTVSLLSNVQWVWPISKHLFLLHPCWPRWSSLMVQSISHQWYTTGYHLSTVGFYQFISPHLKYKLQSLKFIVANGITADTNIDVHTVTSCKRMSEFLWILEQVNWVDIKGFHLQKIKEYFTVHFKKLEHSNDLLVRRLSSGSN